MSKEIVTGSLSDVAKQKVADLATLFYAGVELIAIVDNSSSMTIGDAKNGQARYAVARDELNKLQEQHPGKIAVIQFSDEAVFKGNGLLDYPSGGTHIAGALTFVKPADGCDFTFVLISDGEPYSEEETLRIATTFDDEINTVYVGPEGGPGQAFLKRLAALTGGASDYEGVGRIEGSVTRLLSAKSEVIEL